MPTASVAPSESGRCRVPKCFKTKAGMCQTPNPWVLFRIWAKGRGLRGAALRTAYEKYRALYLEALVPRVPGDSKAAWQKKQDAYRKALCAGRLHPPMVPGPPTAAALRHALDQVEQGAVAQHQAALPCTFTQAEVALMNRLLRLQAPHNLAAGDPALCQRLTEKLLRDVFPERIARRHRVTRRLAMGSNGFAILCAYNRAEQRVVKVQHVAKTQQHVQLLQLQPNRQLQSLVASRYVDEIKAHEFMEMLAQRADCPFRLPAMLGFRKVKFPPNQNTWDLGVTVMEYVAGQTARDAVVANSALLPESILHFVSQDLPRIFRFLHTHHVLHGDLHLNNVIYRGQNRRPFILDFGRTKRFTPAKTSAAHQAFYFLMDYTLTLRSFLDLARDHQGSAYLVMHDKFVEGIRPKVDQHLAVTHRPPDFAEFRSLFTPVLRHHIPQRVDKIRTYWRQYRMAPNRLTLIEFLVQEEFSQ